jgi:signal transduction histidine kinase
MAPAPQPKIERWHTALIRPNPIVWVSLLLYCAVLCAGLYYQWAGLCGAVRGPGQPALFVGLLVFLLALERYEQRRGKATKLHAAAMLGARICLFAGVALADCSGFSRVLYLLVPFGAYFVLGKRASYGLAALALGLFLAHLQRSFPTWYRSQEAISDLLMFCIGLVFAISMAAVASNAQASQARAEELVEELNVSNRRLEAYAEQVAELAAARERNRLARDIHDSLGHYLTAISIQLEKAISFWQHSPPVAEQALWNARRSARQALQDVRHSVSALRQSEELFSLRPGLTELVASAESELLTIDFTMTGEEYEYPKLALMALYRAAQEGLTNIQKHAHAHHAAVTVTLGDHAAELVVTDDGRGFDQALLESPAGQTGRFGLQGMRERLELLGGRMHLTSSLDQGTRLVVIIPISAHHQDKLALSMERV